MHTPFDPPPFRTARALDDQDQVLLNEALGRKPEPQSHDWRTTAERNSKWFIGGVIVFGLCAIVSMLIRMG